MVNRRGFLSRTALSAGALVLPSGLFSLMGGGCASAGRRSDHYFVFYLMVGGWDLMLTTDPIIKEGFMTPFEEDDVVMAGDLRLGPAMKPLKPFMNRLGILKGIHVDALNHPQARFRMITGRFKPPGNEVQAPSVQTLIAQAKGSQYELPNLSGDALRPASFRGNIPDLRLEPVRVSSIDQLKSLTSLRGDLGSSRRDIEEALRAKDAMTTQEWASASGNSPDLPGHFEEFANLQRTLAASDYRERVKAATSLVDDAKSAAGNTGDRSQRQVKLAVEAIKQDLAPVVTVGSGEFDSHSRGEYQTHPAAVMRGMTAVASIAKGLDDVSIGGGRTLLDMTTIVVTSEFSRAPSRNELGGKHHFSTNSILLLGKGVRRGKNGQPRVFGVVDENMTAQAVNPENGSTKRGTEMIEMTHGLATILAIAGIDPAASIRQDPIVNLLA